MQARRARRPGARAARATVALLGALLAGTPAAALEPPSGLAFERAIELRTREFGRPVALAAGPLGRLYLADPARGTVIELGGDGQVGFEFESPPGQPGLSPLDVEAAGFKVYVLDAQSNALLRYDARGSFLDVHRRFESARGDLPRAIAVDVAGRLLLSQAPLHQVRLLDESNRTETVVGGLGSRAGELSRPAGVAFAPEGAFYVADAGNARVQRFSVVGNFERAFGDSLGEPRGLAVGSTGEIYVADPARHAVHLFGPQGVHRATLVLRAWQPIDVAIAGDTLWALSATPTALLRARVQRGE